MRKKTTGGPNRSALQAELSEKQKALEERDMTVFQEAMRFRCGGEGSTVTGDLKSETKIEHLSYDMRSLTKLQTTWSLCR